MGKLTGVDGYVVFGTTYHIKNWTLNWTRDMLEDTDTADSGNKSYVAGLQGATGTFVYDWDTSDTPLTPGATNAELDLYLDSTTGSIKYIKLTTAMINQTSISPAVGTLISITYSFTATSGIAFTTTT